jgi:hypothetical protein
VVENESTRITGHAAGEAPNEKEPLGESLLGRPEPLEVDMALPRPSTVTTDALIARRRAPSIGPSRGSMLK